MKSARNRGEAFEKRRGFLREQCALARIRYVYACAPVAAIADDQRDARSRGRRRRNPQDDKDDRARIWPREEGNAVLARSSRGMTRGERGPRRADSRDRARGRARRANTTEGERRQARRGRYDEARAGRPLR